LKKSPRRNRFWYAIAVAVVILVGMASRRYPLLPEIVDKYPGDVLWTMMVFCLGAIVFPRTSTIKLAGLALFISYAVEFGQLYRAPWIVAIRQTTIGHLILGADFAWGDLIAYTVGALLMLVGESVFLVARFAKK
jgi:hypothetical protein